MKPIRIFISSPGDVAEEREKAREVVAALQRRYADHARLQTVLWEDLPLGADASFQQGIDLVLNDDQGVDIAVFIVWSRLGTPLGATLARADGSGYRSGTEREFDLMLEARKRSGGRRPHILVYLREDDRGFRRRLQEAPKDQIEELILQRRMAESFVAERFRDAEGRNIAAYHTFPHPATFAARLERHLVGHLDDLLRVEAATWTEAPYRGLEVFDLPHAPIFHGRESEASEVVERLQKRVADEGVGFVVIVGASGSGKSSLARAGIAARIGSLARDESVTTWRTASMVPGAWHGLPLQGLVQTLVQPGVLPALRPEDGRIAPLVTALRESPATALPLVLPSAVRLPDGHARVLLVVDQLEELFTDRSITADERRRFLAALEALATSGHCWILATLRGDFYPVAQQEPAFVRLKGASGQYDLLPPAPAAIAQIIQQPARLAGLRFEYSETRRETLDQRLLEDALGQPDTLPLLEYALRELYEQRTHDGLLTFAAYDSLGGVEGALAKRAESVFQSLPSEVQAALPSLLTRLVTVDAEAQSTAVRLRAPWPQPPSGAGPASAEAGLHALVTALVHQRLLTADRDGDDPTVTLTHEALLRSWPRVREWFAGEREFLRVRARVGEAAAAWLQHQRHEDYLLADGRPLAEARDRLEHRTPDLSPPVAEYLDQSIRSAEDRRATMARRRRRIITGTTSLAGVSLIAAIVATLQWRSARTQRSEAEKARDRATAARKASDGLARYILFDLRDKLTALGRQDLLAEANQRFQTYQTEFGASEGDLEAERLRMVALGNEGDILKARATGTNIAAALKRYEEALAIARKLAVTDPANHQWQRDISFSLNKVAELKAAAGDRDGALRLYQESLELRRKLAAADPANVDWQRDVSVSLNNVADLKAAAGDRDGALRLYQESLSIARRLAAAAPANVLWQHDVSVCLNRVAGIKAAVGDRNGALRLHQESLDICRKLANDDPANVQWQRNVSVCLGKVARLKVAAGDRDGALRLYQESLSIGRKLAAADPFNVQWQRDVSIDLDHVAHLKAAVGDRDGALRLYQESLELRRKLAAADLDNVQAQHDVSVSFDNVADLKVAAGDCDGALRLYTEALQLRRKLAASNPDNVQWQRDVSISLIYVADLKAAVGDRDGAMRLCQESLEIRRKLAASDSANVDWQRDVSISLDNVAELKATAGDRDGALRLYQEALEIRRKLAASDSANVDWQRDVSISLDNVAELKATAGDRDGALRLYQEALEIRRKLAAADPANVQGQRDVSISLDNVARHKAAAGNRHGAISLYQESLEIRRKLAAADPANVQWQHDISIGLDNVADLKAAAGDRDGALRLCEESLELRRKLAAADPANVEWQRNVSIGLASVAGLKAVAGDRDGALRLYQESLELRRKLVAIDPANLQWQRALCVAWERIGFFRIEERDFNGALAAFAEERRAAERLVASLPTPSSFQVARGGAAGMGRALIQLKRLAEAVEAHQAAVRISEAWLNQSPADSEGKAALRESLGELADAHAAADQHEEALSSNTRLLRIDPENEGALRGRPGHLAALARWKDAAQAQRTWLAYVQKNTLDATSRKEALPPAYLGLSYYLLHTREFSEALAATDKGLALDGNYLPLDTNRAHALLFLGRTAEAEALYRRHIGRTIGDATWEKLVLEDLEALTKAGVTHPEFSRIRQLMRGK